MKVIDLLNKIANGEELPKKIKWYDQWKKEEYTYNFIEVESDYKCDENGTFLFNSYFMTECLNDKVEIIEEQEDKKIENIYFSLYDFQRNERDTLEKIEKKFNELIDEVNKLKGDNNE
jgi:hypothetical protein